jgi:hypothetical protein
MASCLRKLEAGNATITFSHKDQSPSCKANSHSISQDRRIPGTLSCLQKPMDPILSQTNLVHTMIPISLISISILSSYLQLGLPSGLFLSDFHIKILYDLFSPKWVLCSHCKREWIDYHIINWNVTSCSPVEVHRRFGGTYCFHLQGRRASRKQAIYDEKTVRLVYFSALKIDAVSSSEMLWTSTTLQGVTLLFAVTLWELQVQFWQNYILTVNGKKVKLSL